MGIYDTSHVKREWIHIRWAKCYVAQFLDPGTSMERNRIYQALYDNHPIGPKFYPSSDLTYPAYMGYNNDNVSESMFPHNNFVLVSRHTNLSWISSHRSDDPTLVQMVTATNPDLVSIDIELSQEQEDLNMFSTEMYDNEDENEDEYEKRDHAIYTDKLALFKRARLMW